MILSFRDSEAEKIFNGESSRRLPAKIQRNIRRKLLYLNAAATLMDICALPGNRLEKLQGNKKETYSIRVNSQWRICFAFEVGNAYDVEVVDYHS